MAFQKFVLNETNLIQCIINVIPEILELKAISILTVLLLFLYYSVNACLFYDIDINFFNKINMKDIIIID